MEWSILKSTTNGREDFAAATLAVCWASVLVIFIYLLRASHLRSASKSRFERWRERISRWADLMEAQEIKRHHKSYPCLVKRMRAKYATISPCWPRETISHTRVSPPPRWVKRCGYNRASTRYRSWLSGSATIPCMIRSAAMAIGCSTSTLMQACAQESFYAMCGTTQHGQLTGADARALNWVALKYFDKAIDIISTQADKTSAHTLMTTRFSFLPHLRSASTTIVCIYHLGFAPGQHTATPHHYTPSPPAVTGSALQPPREWTQDHDEAWPLRGAMPGRGDSPSTFTTASPPPSGSQGEEEARVTRADEAFNTFLNSSSLRSSPRAKGAGAQPSRKESGMAALDELRKAATALLEQANTAMARCAAGLPFMGLAARQPSDPGLESNRDAAVGVARDNARLANSMLAKCAAQYALLRLLGKCGVDEWMPVESYKYTTLQAMCRGAGVSSQGTRAVLQARLNTFLFPRPGSPTPMPSSLAVPPSPMVSQPSKKPRMGDPLLITQPSASFPFNIAPSVTVLNEPLQRGASQRAASKRTAPSPAPQTERQPASRVAAMQRVFNYFTSAWKQLFSNRCGMNGCEAVIANAADACEHHNSEHRHLIRDTKLEHDTHGVEGPFHPDTVFCKACGLMVIVQPTEGGMVRAHKEECAAFTKRINSKTYDLGKAGTFRRVDTTASLTLSDGRKANNACFYNACATSGGGAASAIHDKTFKMLRDPTPNIARMIKTAQRFASIQQNDGPPSIANLDKHLRYCETFCDAGTIQCNAAAEALQRRIEVYSDNGCDTKVYGEIFTGKQPPIRIWHNGLFRGGHYEGMEVVNPSAPSAPTAKRSRSATPARLKTGTHAGATSPTRLANTAPTDAPRTPAHRKGAAGAPGSPDVNVRTPARTARFHNNATPTAAVDSPPASPSQPMGEQHEPPSQKGTQQPVQPLDSSDPIWSMALTFPSQARWTHAIASLFTAYHQATGGLWDIKRRLFTMILDRSRYNAVRNPNKGSGRRGKKGPDKTSYLAVNGALAELDDNNIGRANRRLASSGLAEDGILTREAIRAKYPMDCPLPPPEGCVSTYKRPFVLQGISMQRVRLEAMEAWHKGAAVGGLSELQKLAMREPKAPPDLQTSYEAARENAEGHVADGIDRNLLPSYLRDALDLDMEKWGERYPQRSQADVPEGYSSLITDLTNAHCASAPDPPAPDAAEGNTAPRIDPAPCSSSLPPSLRPLAGARMAGPTSNWSSSATTSTTATQDCMGMWCSRASLTLSMTWPGGLWHHWRRGLPAS